MSIFFLFFDIFFYVGWDLDTDMAQCADVKKKILFFCKLTYAVNVFINNSQIYKNKNLYINIIFTNKIDYGNN